MSSYLNLNYLTKYCNENKVELITTYEKVTRETIIKGKCIEEKCENTFEKTFRRMVQNAGPRCYKCSRKLKSEKAKITYLEKYGVEHNFKSEEIKEKIKKTNLEKYGMEYHSQNKEIKEKKKQINLERYGVENIFQSENIKQKIKDTCLEKYGVEHVMKNKEIKEKSKQTCLEKYGVENVSQNPEIFEKAINSCFKSKEYILPSGKKIKVQGYEPFALNKLIYDEKIDENDIITDRKNVPECWWYDEDNKKHRYYVDIYIPSQKKCIEVKSEYTFKKEENKVLLKQKSINNLGYTCELWIFDTKGQLKIN